MSLQNAVNETVEIELNELLRKRRDAVTTELIEGFRQVRKKTVADLDDRVAQFQDGIRSMVAGLSIQFVQGEVVVKATGSGELTLRLLKAGGQWFDPVPDVNDRIMRGLYT